MTPEPLSGRLQALAGRMDTYKNNGMEITATGVRAFIGLLNQFTAEAARLEGLAAARELPDGALGANVVRLFAPDECAARATNGGDAA